MSGEPTVILYTYINRHAGTPNKTKTKDTMSLDTHNSSILLHLIIIIVGSTIAIRWVSALFKKNLNASKPSEHPPQVEECLKV